MKTFSISSKLGHSADLVYVMSILLTLGHLGSRRETFNFDTQIFQNTPQIT